MSEPSAFEVFERMCSIEPDCIFMAPLSNVHRMQVVKGGGKATIGVDRECIDGLKDGRFCGGLLLADREVFEKVRKEIEESRQEPPIYDSQGRRIRCFDCGSLNAVHPVDGSWSCTSSCG